MVLTFTSGLLAASLVPEFCCWAPTLSFLACVLMNVKTFQGHVVDPVMNRGFPPVSELRRVSFLPGKYALELGVGCNPTEARKFWFSHIRLQTWNPKKKEQMTER